MYEIAIIRLLSFLFLDDFEGNANTSVTIKSGSTVANRLVARRELRSISNIEKAAA